MHDSEPEPSNGRPEFTTTQWSVVLAAGEEDSPQANAALEQLCRTYWYPLYAFVRRNGCDSESAKDLVQEFFARLLHRRDFENARQEKGRFRSYLLVMLKHFLVNEKIRARAQKRGGGATLISIDQMQAEDRYDLEPPDRTTPETLFERRWAMALLDAVMQKLAEEYKRNDREHVFELLKGFISEGGAPPQAAIAHELGLSEGAVKQAVFRLKGRYREILHEQVAQTVGTAADVTDELRHLIAALRS